MDDEVDNASESSDGLGSFWGYQSEISVEEDEESSSSTEGSDIAHELLSGLNPFRETQMFCDIRLKADDILIPAHKIVLCACSPYFSAMFSGQFKEKDKDVVEIEEIDGKYLRLIVDYIYTGNLHVTLENVRSILDVANFLQINSAQEICCETLSEEIKVSNCLEFMEFAGKRRLKTLFHKATKCAAKHFFEILSKKEFLMLEFDEFDAFLREKELRKYSDDIVLSALHRWVEYSPKNRLQYLSELLCYVNPGHVTKELVEKSEYLKTNVSCNSWIQESEKSIPTRWNLYIFNKLGYYTAEKVVLDTKEGHKLKRPPAELCHSSYTGYGSTIFMQGGWVSMEGFTDKSYCYNAYKQNWNEFLPLTLARADHRSIVHDGSLFIIGGKDNKNTFSIVETLDLGSGRYVSTKSLSTPRASFGLASLGNSLYVIGGDDGNLYLSTVERYDPREGFWETLPIESYSKAKCASAVLGNSIYSSMGPGYALERFDVKANKWFYIKTISEGHPKDLFTADNELYGIFDKKICKYLVTKGKWQAYRRIYPFTEYAIAVPLLIC